MDEKDIKQFLTFSRECDKCGGEGRIGEAHGFGPGGIDPEDNRVECDECFGSGFIVDSVISDILLEHGITRPEVAKITEKIYKHIGDKLLEAYKRGTKEGVIESLIGTQKPQEGQGEAK